MTFSPAFTWTTVCVTSVSTSNVTVLPSSTFASVPSSATVAASSFTLTLLTVAAVASPNVTVYTGTISFSVTAITISPVTAGVVYTPSSAVND